MKCSVCMGDVVLRLAAPWCPRCEAWVLDVDAEVDHPVTAGVSA